MKLDSIPVVGASGVSQRELASRIDKALPPDTETITEWKKPLAWEAPYDVLADHNREVWEVNTFSDRVGRLDPKSGEWTNYLLPRSSNIRRVFVDDRKSPVTVWIGNNLGAAVIKVEPLD